MSESKLKFDANSKRIAEIKDELAIIPQQLVDLESLLSSAQYKERLPIYELKNKRDSLVSEQGILERENMQLDRIITWEIDGANAQQVIKSSPKLIQAAQKDISKLEATLDGIDSKLSALKGDANAVNSQADEAEQKAAKAYAEAMTGGDADAEKKALTALEAASAQVDAAQRKGVQSARIITALEGERATTKAALDAATEKLKVLETAQIKAVRLQIDANWDSAVLALIDTGAQLIAAGRMGGGQTRTLEDVSIPLTSLTGKRSVTGSQISEQAATYSLSSLLAAVASGK